MSNAEYPVNVHDHYHAHVYFDDSSHEFARSLCEEAGDTYGLEVGRFHERPVGPHTVWSCQIKFDAEHFETFIPWLDKKRKDLTIFVHGLTGDDFKDHTDYAYWLGDPVPLNLDIFKSG